MRLNYNIPFSRGSRGVWQFQILEESRAHASEHGVVFSLLFNDADGQVDALWMGVRRRGDGVVSWLESRREVQEVVERHFD